MDDLHDQLVQMGRRPVPAPRPEFVKSLLERIQLGEDLPVPEPIPLTRRQPWARARMVAVGAIAASVLAAFGLFSLVRQGSGGDTATVISASPVNAIGESKQMTVGADGEVDIDHGSYDTTCPVSDPRIPTARGVVQCTPNEALRVEITDYHVQEVIPVDGAAESALSATTTAPGTAPTTETPPTTVATPATVPSGSSDGSASASVVTTTVPTSTTPSTNPAPTATPGGSAPAAAVNPSFELSSTYGDGTVTLTWPQYKGSDFGSYVVLRTSSLSDKIDTPTYTPIDTQFRVGQLNSITQTSSQQVFEGVVPVNTLFVSYRVAVLDGSGKVVALSTTTTLQLDWKLKPSEADPATTTTTPPSPPTTAGGGGASSVPGGGSTTPTR